MLTSKIARPFLLSSLALAMGLFSNTEAMAGDDKTQSSLVRPDDGLDANAKGTLRLRSREDGSRERFELHARRVDATVTHDVFIETEAGSGVMEFVAAMVPDDDSQDEMFYRVDTKHDGILPGSVSTTAELAGRLVEVRIGLNVILHTVTPAFGLPKKLKAKDDLDTSDDAEDSDAEGRIKLRARMQKGDQRFEVKIKDMPAGLASFHMFVDDGLGTMTEVGVFDMDGGDNDKGKFRLRMKDGQALPFGVWELTTLEGRAIEVRDNLGVVYLEGTIPELD